MKPPRMGIEDKHCFWSTSTIRPSGQSDGKELVLADIEVHTHSLLELAPAVTPAGELRRCNDLARRLCIRLDIT